MSLMFIALLCSYAFVAVLFFALFYLADRIDRARRNRPAPVVIGPLPRMSVATKWRRDRW